MKGRDIDARTLDAMIARRYRDVSTRDMLAACGRLIGAWLRRALSWHLWLAPRRPSPAPPVAGVREASLEAGVRHE